MIPVVRFMWLKGSRGLGALLVVLGCLLGVAARAQSRDPILRIETGTHTGRTADAATDAAGRVLVTVGEDKTARIWSLPDLQPLGVLRPQIGPAQQGLLFAVAVSPDGRLAAVAGALGRPGAEKLVLLFDLRTREVVRTWAGSPNGTYSLAFSADGTKLAAGFGGAHGIAVWSVADGREVLRDRNYADAVYGLSFAKDDRLATSSLDHFIRLYDATGRLLRKVNVATGGQPIRAAFSPDGRKLAVGFVSGRVHVFDGHTLDLIDQVGPFGMPGDRAGIMRMLTLLLNPANTIPFSHTTELGEVAWSSDGRRLFAGGDAWIRANANALPSMAALIWLTDSLGLRPITLSSPRQIGPRGFINTGFEDTIGRIIPLANNSIVATSLSGDIALIGPDGRRRAAVRPVAADFRAQNVGTLDLAVSGDGKRVAWSQRRSNGRWEIADTSGFGLTTAAKEPAGLYQSATEDDSRNHRRTIFLEPWRWSVIGPELNFENYNSKPRALAIDPDEKATSGAVQTNQVLLGTEYMLRLYDGKGNPVWSRHIPGAALQVNLALGGQVAVAALGDGTIRWYRLRDGKELLALFLTHDAKRWVVFTPSGYYDASPGGEDLFGWLVNRGPDHAADFFPASRFHDRLYRPDVVRRILDTLDEAEALRQANAASGRADPKVTLTDIAALAPPVLELISAPERFNTDRVVVKFRVHTPAHAQMIGDPLVKVDGEWQPTSRAVSQIAADDSRQVVIGPLPPQDSTIEIYGDNRNARSEPLRLTLKWDGRAAVSPGQQGAAAQHKPRLFVLAVGVSQYQRPDLRLNFAARDAEQFVAAMESQKGKQYSDVIPKLLRNDEATRSGVQAGLTWFASQAAADDVGVLFLAGHGVETPDKAYFYAPADFDPAHQHATGVDYKSIRAALDKFSTSGNKVLFFVDTCYPGGALGVNLASSNGASFAEMLSRPDSGIIVLSGSKGDQLSYESPLWRDGAFTKAVLEGIVDGKADPAQSGEITVFDLGSYIHKRVLVLTNRRQEPTLSMPEGGISDFAVAAH